MANPTKSEVKAGCAEMLQMDLYVIMTTPTNGTGPVMENLATHLEHQIWMEQQGHMFAAGPLWSKDDANVWDGEGMFIIRAKSIEHARELADADPMHKSGARSYTLRSWMLNEGSFSVRVTYSDGKAHVS